MPTVQGNGIDICCEVQGDGEPLVLIPYLAADRFAGPLTAAVPGAEVGVFEPCSHAPIHADVAGFNQRTLAFPHQHSG